MRTTTDPTLMEAVRETAHPLTAAPQAYDPLLDLVRDARLVLLGEASHGSTISTTPARRSPSGSSASNGSPPSQSRLTGPMPTASIATCAV